MAEHPPGLRKRTESGGRHPVAAPGGGLFAGVIERDDLLYPFAAESGRAMPPLTLPGDDRTEDGPVTDAAFSPDGTLFATTAEHAGHLKVWDAAAGRLLAARTVGEGSLRLAFAPDGRSLAVCGGSGTLVFDLPAPRVADVVALQPYPVADAAPAASGGKVAVSAVEPNGAIRVTEWADPGDRRPAAPTSDVSTVEVMRNNAPRVAVSADGVTIAASSADLVWWYNAGRAVVWSSRQWPARVPGPPVTDLDDLRFGPGDRLWVVAGDGVTSWSEAGGRDRTFAHPDAARGVRYRCVAPGRGVVLAGRSDGAIDRLPAGGGPPAASYPVLTGRVTAVGLRADERLAAVGGAAGEVKLVRPETGEVIVDLPDAHRDAVQSVAFGPGGWFATGSRDRTVRVWDAAGRLVLALPQTRPVARVFVSADGRTLTVLAEGERGLRRWRLDHLREGLAGLGLDLEFP